VPILMTIVLLVHWIKPPPTYNFRMTDWEEFTEELEIRLADMPAPVPLTSKALFQVAIEDLTGMIQDTICTTIPTSKPSPHAKRWWNKELSNLKKKKNRLSSSSYKNHTMSKHPAHEQHRKIGNEYGEAIMLLRMLVQRPLRVPRALRSGAGS
jgi:hypothetical protein